MKYIGDTFSSYTYTDISEGYFEKAAELFKAHSHKMTYKVFDTENAPSSQEFEENSYDVVIASNVRHASSSLQKTLENTRRLLKPGGYLLMSDVTDNGPIRIQTMMEGLGGVDGGRKMGPTGTLRWHSVLHKAGFSGVDTITPEVDGVAWPFSVIATQAVDNRIKFLRKPLLSSASVHLDELVILGNGSPKTSRIAEDVSELAERFYDKVTILDGLPTDDDEIPPMTTFINLVDLDEPIFKNITEEKMEGLKCLFELSRNVLWITEGARADEPYHNASIGFGRSIAYEMPHLSLQFLDFADGEYTTSSLIAEAVLRLAAMDEWDTKTTLRDELLWSKEPELYLEDGQLLVPRILPNDDQNDRINSLRRSVTKVVNPHSPTVRINQAADSSLFLEEQTIPQLLGSVQVSNSILSALNVAPETFLFLGVGINEATGDNLVSLSDTNSSNTISSISVSANFPAEQASVFLASTASELLAASVVSKVPTNCRVLVHEPDDFFASALARQAAAKNIRVTFSTTKSDTKNPAWIKLDPWTSEHIVKTWIPAKLTHFLDFAADDTSHSIRECLPSGCREMNVSDLFRDQSLLPTTDDGTILKALDDAVRHAKATALDKTPSATIRSGQISDQSVPKYPTSIVDWISDSVLTVQVQSLNASRLFSRDKTYLLVGLSGHIGQSISEWMSRNGAENLCLMSRSPKSDVKWQALMKEAGATVKDCTV